MKVIAPGKDSIGWAKEFECTGKGNEGLGCGAKLLVEEGDLWHIVGYSWGESESYYTFICPLCGCMTDISDSHITSAVRDSVRKRCEGRESVNFVRSESERVKTKRMQLRMQGGNG